MKKIYILLLLLLLLFTIGTLKIYSQANPTNVFYHSIAYHTENQSMWSQGDGFSFDMDYDLIPPQANPPGGPNGGVSEHFSDSFGFSGASLSYNFGVHFRSTFSIHGFTLGTIDNLYYPVIIMLDYPDHYSFDHGQTIDIQTSYIISGARDLTPIFPSGGIVSLDLEYGINIGFGIDLPVVGGDSFDITIPPISFTDGLQTDANGVVYDSIAIFYINAITGEVAYPCLDQYNFPTICNDDLLPISIPDWFGIGLTGEMNIPHIDEYPEHIEGSCGSYCLVAEGENQWAWFNLDVLDFLQFFIGFIPGYGEAINTAIDIIQGDFDIIDEYFSFAADYICLDYYILNIDIYMASTLHQEFRFCPTIEATFTFPTQLEYWEINPNNGNAVVESGVNNVMTIDVCNKLRIKYPCYEWDSMQVLSVHYHLIPTFSNRTWNRFDFYLIFQMLYFNFCIDIPILKSTQDTLPQFVLPLADNEDISSSSIEINSLDVNQHEIAKRSTRQDCSGMDCDWGFSFGPLIDINLPLGGFDLNLYNNTWLIGLNGNNLNANGEWVSTDWNYADTTVAGTWLYPRPELGITTNHVDVICYGDTTGQLIVTANPSTTGQYTYDYSWMPTTHVTNSTTDVLYVPSGHYSVTLTDVWGCSKSAEFDIIDLFPNIEYTLAEDDALCYGSPTGNLYSEVSGGSPPYTWQWSPSGQNVQNPTGVYAGWHNVTITDSQGCTKTGSIYVDQPPQNIVTPTVTNVSCFGFSDGAITVVMSGGTPPYAYAWSNGATSSSITGLIAGTYTVTITDSQGCVSIRDVIVSEPSELLLNTTQINVLCHGESTGAIDLTITGGAPPYTITWSNGAVTEDLNGIAAGSYSATVTDENGCTDNFTIIITEPLTALSSTIVPTHNICFGAAEGAANLTVEGGVSPYTYAWSNGQTTEDIYNLVSATYYVTITDANGCTLVNSVFIEQPPQIVLTPSIQHISCFGMNNGAITVVASGGNDPYTYLWSNGSTLPSLINLPPGAYTVTVTDAIGCVVVRTYNIIEPALLEVSNVVVTDVLCYGENTGAINITITGGTIPYSYSWSNGTVIEDLSGLFAGVYSLTVTDNNGCIAYQTVQVAQPMAPISMSALIQNVTCYGGSDGAVDVTVTGGTQPYTYLWNNYETTQDLVNVVSNTYTVIVTDSHGCKDTLEIFVSQPPLLVVTGTINNASCNGLSDGSINISVSGGVLPYQYHWSNGSTTTNLINISAGSYTLTVVDAHNCIKTSTFVVTEPQPLILVVNITDILCFGQSTGLINLTVTGGTLPYSYAWNTGQTTEDISNISAGTYYVSVTDNHGCSNSIEAVVMQPALPLTAVITPHSITCFAEADGIADLTVTGGTEPYFYNWSTGAISEDIENLTPATYTVTVIDNHYCMSIAQTQITQSSAPMSGTITGTNVVCNGDTTGNIYIAITGGTLPYHFTWSTGSWEQNLINVRAGNYTVTVTDANYCKIQLSYTVQQPNPFYIYPYPVPKICSGMSTEIGLALVTGNTPPYTVQWNHGASGMMTNVIPSHSTTYTAIVTDVNGCVSNPTNITINVTDTVQLDVSTYTDTVCSGKEIHFFVNVLGGGISGKYVYINGVKTPITVPIRIQVFNDTTFVFEVLDTCGFNKTTVTRHIHVAPNPPIDAGSDKMAGCSPLKVAFFENSPDIGQKYLWNFDDGDFENLSLDKYPTHIFYSSKNFKVRLTVESQFGCESETIIPIFVYPVPVAAFVVNSTVLDIENPRVEFSDHSENPYYYSWDFGDGETSNVKNPIHSYTEIGEYIANLTITTMYGCIDTTKMKIQVNYSNIFYAPTAFTPNADGTNDEFRVFVTNYESNSFEMKILDRWGEVVFKSDNPEKGWDGLKEKRVFPAGVYVWIVKYRDMHGEELTKTGKVTLLK